MAEVRGARQVPSGAPAESVFEAVLERVTYANEETGYTIARVATERLRLSGRWTSHPRYGRQFEVRSYSTVLPATIQGIQRYLGSGLIRGIGPVMAGRMVAHFGTDILRVIEEKPQRLIEVPGVGPKRTQLVAQAWETARSPSCPARK